MYNNQEFSVDNTRSNTFDNLIDLVVLWASDKGILKPENAPKQAMKVMEELGETMGAILKKGSNSVDVADGIGDTFVTLIILSKQLGLEPVECLSRAWGEIRDRTGKTVNGIFVKD